MQQIKMESDINGYKIKIKDEIKDKNKDKHNYQDLKCVICHEVYTNPVYLKICKHRYCKNCIEKVKNSNYKFCSLCKGKNIEYEEDYDLNKFINNIKVHCKNKSCKYIMKYEDNKKHSKICYYEKIRCIICNYNGIRRYHNEDKCFEISIELIEISKRKDEIIKNKKKEIYLKNLKILDYEKKLKNLEKEIQTLINRNKKEKIMIIQNNENKINKLKREKIIYSVIFSLSGIVVDRFALPFFISNKKSIFISILIGSFIKYKYK